MIKREIHMPESTIKDPLKRWKHLLISPNFLNPILMKSFLAICLLAGFSLCYYSVFPCFNNPINCSNRNRTFLHASYKLFVNTAQEDDEDDKTNISHIFFGIGGSAETWSTRRHYCELWWRPNITRGYVWLDEEPINPWPETSPGFKVSANTSLFKYTCSYGSRSAVRIARIVKESFELGLENVRWFVMGDDDTVFFTENLVSVLNKYDHREMYYIGGNSESIEQDLVHSYTMGYGGGGFAISYPLAAELVRVLDGCIDRYSDLYGSDQKIGACMTEIGVPLTKELGFHQVDIRGNPYGLLSAHPLAPLVSLHHLDYVQPIYPTHNRVASVKKLVDAYKSDPSRILQHSFCYDLTRNWSISVSWGYNVQLYPFLMSGKDLNTPLQTFLTWGSWSQEPFAFNTRLWSMDPCEQPVIYFFDGVEDFSDRSTLSWYSSPNDNRTQCDREDYNAAYLVNGFNVSVAVFDPEIWTKAPRRQCCELVNDTDSQDSVIHVRIRGCNPGESVSPPWEL